MPTDRPTFSESWYRVANMKPRLRPAVQTFRQHYRGRAWHVVRDPSNNQFFRLDDAAYHFVGLLDGRRTVDEAWKISGDHLGDRAPTQGEAIRLLGQLYGVNLLAAEMPPDAQGMFERYRKRVNREVAGHFLNILFPRFPLLNPDRFLNRWVGTVGWVFSWAGLAVWSVMLIIGFTALSGRWGELFKNAANVLEPKPDNLVLLFLSFAVIKAIHEFGHAFACKKFGLLQGGGDVHTVGIMLLVLMPTPYVDASTSWTFRNKWHRAIVGAAGMYVELFVASIMALVWVNTSPGIVHALAYNVLFVASVSTVLFNANPLLRYDGYYILSDLMEIPNLGQRSKDYCYYLVKRYAYGVKQAISPANTPGERFWLFIYAITSGIYRIFVSFLIILYIMGQEWLFFLGVLMGLGAIIGWVVVPLGKFIQYLAVNQELARVRVRAITVTAVFAAATIGILGLIPMSDPGYAEGIVDSRGYQVIYMPADGFIRKVADSGSAVAADGLLENDQPLAEAENQKLQLDRDQLQKELEELRIDLTQKYTQDPASRQATEQDIRHHQERIQRMDEQLAMLKHVRASTRGQWVCHDGPRMIGAYIPQGEKLGQVLDRSAFFIRVSAEQKLGPRIGEEIGVGKTVQIRVIDRPDLQFTGRITAILPVGTNRLVYQGLAAPAGGQTKVVEDKPGGQPRSEEREFEVQIEPDQASLANSKGGIELFYQQRVIVRFDLHRKPLLVQWWLAFRQLVQKRFQV